MRTAPTTLFLILWLALGPPSPLKAVAAPGEKIGRFLRSMAKQRFLVEFLELGPTFKPTEVGSRRPPQPTIVGDHSVVLEGRCGDAARQKLSDVLKVASESPSQTFQPDYCVFCKTDEAGRTCALWIASTSPHLQMRFYASDGTVDECGIHEDTQGRVHDTLGRIAPIAKAAEAAIADMVTKIEWVRLPIDLMSLDPAQSEDVFGQKRWKRLGRVSIPMADTYKRDIVVSAIVVARTFPPAHTAHSFTPRLAVSADVPETLVDRLVGGAPDIRRVIDQVLPTPVLVVLGEPTWLDQGMELVPPSTRRAVSSQLPAPLTALWPRRFFVLLGPGRHFMLLMSFECRLAELYIDGKSQGFVAISNAWSSPGRMQYGATTSVPVAAIPDQFLNDILVAARQQLKPKSTSSSN
jgi:hypothetical protein